MNAISIPPIVMATLIFYVGFYHFLIYRRQRDNRENLTFALSCFSVGLYAICCAGLYNASSPEVGVEWQRLQSITLAVLAIALLWFITDYTNRTNKKIVMGFTVCYLFTALAGLLIKSDLTWTSVASIKEIQLPLGYDIRYNEMVPGVLTDLQSIVGLIYFIYILTVSLKFYRSGNKEKGMPLLTAIAILFVGLMNDTFVSSGFYNFIYILEYSYIGMILVFTFFLTNDVIKAGEIKAALRKSEERYRLIAENVADVIWTMDMNFNFTYISPSIYHQRGYTVEEAMVHSLEKIVSGSLEETLNLVTGKLKLIESGDPEGWKPAMFEIEQFCKDGTIIWTSNNASILPGSDGKPISILGITHDITERKQAEKKRMVLESQLRQAQKLEAIGTLSGGIAHDFNNILSGIFGYSQLAETNIHNPEKAKNHIRRIIKGAQRAAELVQQILTFSRQKEYEKHPFKAYLEVKEALKLLRSSIPSTIEIKEKIDSRGMILANPTKIHQVVMNLCTNAYHAMIDKGGILKVSLKDTEISEPKHIGDKKIALGMYLQLEISDTGHGMDDETLEKAFDPYFTTKKIGEGTGLGLSIVQAIVDEHDGFLEVNSIPDKGTNFYIYFPIIEQKTSPKPNKIERTSIFEGNETIMIVDDEEAIRLSFKEILEGYGYRVHLFQNGIDAFKDFKKNPYQFDLIITDMTMPKMTGIELIQRIHNIRQDIPSLLCSGFSGLINDEKAMQMGISKYLMKPVSKSDLASAIRELVDEKKLS